MSTETYDNDCKLITENEDFLIEKINTKHIFGIKKNQYSLEFLQKLYKLLLNDFIDTLDEDTNYIKQIGNYYKGKDDINNMLKYYLIACEKGDSGAMNNLGIYYNQIKDYDNMKKYYLMSIDKNDENAMNNLAIHFHNMKDYPNAKKYYAMSKAKGNKSAEIALSKIEEYEKSLLPKPFNTKFNTEQLDNHLATSMIQMGNISVQLPTKNQIQTKRDLETIINNVNTEIGNTNQYRNVARNIQKLVIYLNALSIKLGLQVQTHNFSKYGV
jgi:TPR repeat protein